MTSNTHYSAGSGILRELIANVPRREPDSSMGIRSFPLQYLRGVAAVCVVLFHTSHYTQIWRGQFMFPDMFGPQFGLFGVTLFFVTSGALMSVLARAGSPSQFMVHRLARIYPTYLILASVLLMISPLVSANLTLDPWALGLVPGGPRTYPLGVEWTLPFEITFYLIIFGIMVLGLGRQCPLIGAGWAALIIAVHFMKPELQLTGQTPSICLIPLSRITLGFALGMVVPAVVRVPGMVMIGLGAGAALLMIAQFDVVHLDWWFACACCCLVAAALTPEAICMPKIHALAALGDWSYAIYLCHPQVIIFLLRFTFWTWSASAMWYLAVVSALALGSIVGIYDVAAYAALKNLINWSSQRLKWWFSAAFAAGYIVAGLVWN